MCLRWESADNTTLNQSLNQIETPLIKMYSCIIHLDLIIMVILGTEPSLVATKLSIIILSNFGV